MPTYEYECTHCDYKFEAVQKMTDKPLSSCPKCGKKVKRLISSGIGVIFKGPGFYATDYRKKPHPGTAGDCAKSKEGCQSCPHAK